MASFTSCSTDIDWLWGSLKPWQILHSTLAERERNGSALDVWELVNETLGVDIYTANSIAREEVLEQEGGGEEKGPSSSSSAWAHGLRFLGDDGEFWKPGGVMESRVREWLSRRDEEQDQLIAVTPLPIPPNSAPHHLHPHQHHNTSTMLHQCSTSSSALAIAACTSSAQHYHSPYSSTISQLQLVAADRRGYGDADDQSSELGSEEEEQEINAGIGDVDDDQGTQLAAAEEDDYRHNCVLIRSNYEDDHEAHRRISSNAGECRTLVVNRYCRAAVAVAAADDYDDEDQFGAAAKLAAGRLHLEEERVEEVEVCAVCLEKLNDEEEEEDDAAVQALACRHLFHRACIAPWLERQPHARCPCCRAPILAPPQLHLAAPLHLATPPPPTCSGHHHHHHAGAPQHDIMGLLADMEAALERLGFRS